MCTVLPWYALLLQLYIQILEVCKQENDVMSAASNTISLVVMMSLLAYNRSGILTHIHMITSPLPATGYATLSLLLLYGQSTNTGHLH